MRGRLRKKKEEEEEEEEEDDDDDDDDDDDEEEAAAAEEEEEEEEEAAEEEEEDDDDDDDVTDASHNRYPLVENVSNSFFSRFLRIIFPKLMCSSVSSQICINCLVQVAQLCIGSYYRYYPSIQVL